MKNILVTGGCGFIGSHLVDKFIEKGNSVLVIDDLSSGLKVNENSNAKYIYNNIVDYISDPDFLDKILKENEIEIIYHLAASADISLSMYQPEKVFLINTMSSIALINSSIRCGVKKFLFASTSAVYGEPTYLPVDLDHPTNPINPYGLSKLYVENYMNYVSRKSMKQIIFRLPNVYGPRQRPDLEGGVVAIFENLMRKNLQVKIFGDGSQTRDWVHVYDIVDAFEKALIVDTNIEVFLLGSCIENTVNDLYFYLSESLNYRKKPIHLEARKGDPKRMLMSNTEANNKISWKPEIILSEGVKIV